MPQYILSKLFLLVLLLLTCCIGTVKAQHTLTGTVIDHMKLPVPYVKVTVRRVTDSIVVGSGITTLDGKYNIEINSKGEYQVMVYSKLYEKNFTRLSITAAHTVAPILQLVPAVVNLKEVTVRTDRAIYDQQIDRLVVNIGNQPAAVSGSVLDVLEKLPGVKVDRQTSSVSLNGKDEVGIMLEGKLVNVPLSSLVQMLSGMDAGNIKQIELITNPPAKYEAGNAGGLINILMKKRTTDGSSGAYTASLGYGDFDKEKTSLNWNSRNKGISFSSDLSYSRDRTFRQFENDKAISTSTSNYSTSTTSSRFPTSANYSGRFGVDVELNNKITLGSTFYGLLNTWDQEVKSAGNITYSPDSSVNLDIFNSENSKRTLLTGSINMLYKIHSKANLQIDADYLHFYNKNPNFYDNDYSINGVSFLRDVFTSEKKTPVNVWAGRADYSMQINKDLLWESGYKATLTSLNNLINVAQLQSGQYITDPDLSGDSHLKESIHAFYISSKWVADKKTTLNAGLRYEYSLTESGTTEHPDVIDRKLGKLFPSLFLSRVLNANSTLLISFGKRINRPTYNDLAPFVLFLDPTTIYNGNITLKPALSNVYTLTYNFRKYTVTTEFINITDPIFRFQPVLSSDNKQVFMPLNLSNSKTFSTLIGIPVSVSTWWQMENSLQGVTQSNRLSGGQTLTDSYYRVKTTQNFTLPKNYAIQLYGSYQSARLTGVSKTSPSNKIDVSIDKKWSVQNRLQLMISNILPDQYHVSSISEGNPDFYALTDYKYESRIVRLTFIHTFGNAKLKAQRKVNKATEDLEERVIK